MTKSELHQYTKRFVEVSESHVSNNAKVKRLSALMMELEVRYDIPAIKNEKFEEENQLLIVMYRTIASTRALTKKDTLQRV